MTAFPCLSSPGILLRHLKTSVQLYIYYKNLYSAIFAFKTISQNASRSGKRNGDLLFIIPFFLLDFLSRGRYFLINLLERGGTIKFK